MFNKIFKFLKNPTLKPTTKQKNRVFLAKDLRQYRIEYFHVINYIVGRNWPLGNKSIDLENLKLVKIFKLLLQIIILKLIILMIIY